MGRSLTNNFGLNYGIEPSIGASPTTWKRLEPNNPSNFGSTITTVARNPISTNRQALKGSVTDLDSSVGFDADLTKDSFRDFIQTALFATGINADVTDLVSTAAETTTDSYAVVALTAGQANKFEVGTLIFAKGFSNAGNNGIKEIDADIATSATALTVAENLVDEGTAPASARISFSGFRISAVTVVTWTWNGGTKRATMNATGVGTTLIGLGLTPGQFVHVGSDNGSDVAQNAFENATASDMFGYARVVSVTANDVVFDKVDVALRFTDGTDPAGVVDIVFGEFIRNVDVNDAAFLEQYIQFEGGYKGLDVGDADMYEYAKGNLCDTFTFNLPAADKATVTFGFVGTDTEPPVSVGSRKAGASTAISPTELTAFNTSSDIINLRIADVDETGLSTDFKSVSLSLTNSVTPEKVLGNLGAKFLNIGNFGVVLTSELVFTNSLVIDRIRSNATVSVDFVIKNDNGAIAVDIPSLTLGDGSRSFPENSSITVALTGTAFKDDTLGTSIGVSTFTKAIP